MREARTIGPFGLLGSRRAGGAGYYTGGTSVIDFSEPLLAGQVAYYDAVTPQSDSWSSYWYNGYIYSNDGNRGFDVFRLDIPEVAGAFDFDYMNPQTQEGLPVPVPPEPEAAPTVLGSETALTTLAATGRDAGLLFALAFLVIALAIPVALRRR